MAVLTEYVNTDCVVAVMVARVKTNPINIRNNIIHKVQLPNPKYFLYIPRIKLRPFHLV